MAILQEASSKSNNPFLELVKDDLAPAGTWVATIIDIRDQFGIVRPSFDNPQVTEIVDLTTFLFGFRDQAGQPHRIASKTMRISGNEKSTLFGFLKAALGCAPKYGWDYCEMKGRTCLVTVAHEQRHNGQGVFPSIAALCPVPAGMTGGNGGQRTEAGGQTGCNTQPAKGTAQAGGGQAAMPQVGPAPVTAYSAAPTGDDEELPF